MGTIVGDDGAGNQIGMAPGARWIGCRNMDRGNGTPLTYTECFQWFIAPTDLSGNHPDPSKAPDVINDSWLCPPSEGCTDPMMLQTLVQTVRAAGIVVVASAGNTGPDCSTIVWAPSLYDPSFTVGATDATDAIASFSSRGPVIQGTNTLIKPDISAPGLMIRSSALKATYSVSSGTSMAGPHVTGLVALLISAHPELRGQVDGIERIIEHSAVHLTSAQNCGGLSGALIPNPVFGWGRIDALAALGLGDSDGDGIPDWWEWWHNLDSANASDAHDDPDGDGMDNLAEYLTGTDPRDATSYFHITSASANPWPTLEFESLTNRLYTLSFSTQVTSTTWSNVSGQVDIPGNDGILTLSDESAPEASCRFYRVKVRVR
jgi:subtilisin family serine protease